MENKMIPKLRFPEFEGVWNLDKLGLVAKFSKGKGIAKADITENGSTECIRYGELYTEYSEVITDIVSKTNIDEADLILSEENDVIIPASGETQIDIATASCVTKSGVALGGDLNIIKSTINGIFLSYYLNNTQKTNIARLSQGISVVHLYASQLKSLNIHIPEPEEQIKIANFLTAVDKRINLLQKKKVAMEQYKKGVMQKLFSQSIRFKDENGNDFPDWEEKKLGEILTSYSEKTITNNKYQILSSTKDGIYLQSEYFTRDIASKNNIGYKILRKGQLVISPQNIWMGNINLNKSFNIGIVSPSYKIFNFNMGYDCVFFGYFLKQPQLIFEYGKCSEQGASIVRRNLNLSLFLKIKFKIPHIQEQQKIANFLSAIDKSIEKLGNQIDDTEMFKKGLLQKMFV